MIVVVVSMKENSEIKKFLLTNFLFIFNSTDALCVHRPDSHKKKMMMLIYLERLNKNRFVGRFQSSTWTMCERMFFGWSLNDKNIYRSLTLLMLSGGVSCMLTHKIYNFHFGMWKKKAQKICPRNYFSLHLLRFIFMLFSSSLLFFCVLLLLNEIHFTFLCVA